MPEPASTAPDGKTAQGDRVPLSQKLGYGLGSFQDMWGHWLYPALVYLVFNIYLGVPPKWIARALLFKLVFEAVWDSVFGWWSDNVRTRFGRRRPFLLVGGVLAGCILPLLFQVRAGWTDLQYFGFMVSTLALLVPIMSCFYMPFQSLGAELTPDYHERTSINATRNAVQKIPELAMFAAGAFCTAGVWVAASWQDVPSRLARLLGQTGRWFGNVAASLATLDFARFGALMKTIFGWAPAVEGAKPNILIGAQAYTTVLGTILIVTGVLVFALTRERYYDKIVASRQGKISIKDTLWKALSCKPFRANLFMALSYGIGTSMISTLGYYCTIYYVCRGNVAIGNSWNFWMGLASMLLGFCGIPVYTKLSRILGKKKAMIGVQICAIAVGLSSWWLYNPAIDWLQVFYSGFTAFTGAGFWILYYSMTADVIDADELETHQRREGAFSACGSWILKLGVAIGSWASGEILSQTGFDATLGGNQTAHAILTMRLLFATIPVAGSILALIFVIRFPLTPQRMEEIRGSLEARRGKV
jgi:GPH family glycoside/pentoside/hexuronide:cation symporter